MRGETCSEADLARLLGDPRPLQSDPYALYSAFALQCLADLTSGDEEDEEAQPGPAWGSRIPRKILDRAMAEMADDFLDAVACRKPVRIRGVQVSVRRGGSLDREKMLGIFGFPADSEDYVVEKGGVARLEAASPKTDRNCHSADRTYLRQVVMLAESGDGGWEALTDMEAAMYCWGQFHSATGSENLAEFLRRYAKHLCVSAADFMSCYSEKSEAAERPRGVCPLSAERVREWNRARGQRSAAEGIDPELAAEHWFGTALKTTFRPRG